MTSAPDHRSPFDDFARDYDAALNRGLSLTGERKEFFARGRVRWLSECLRQRGAEPRRVLDYGCGTGTSCALLSALPSVTEVVGVDLSSEILAVARQHHPSPKIVFLPPGRIGADARFDLVFCNGVFHHIAPAKRGAALRWIHSCLRPDGLFSFWENNPWNPGTRYSMKRVPFDRDAIPISAPFARHLLQRTGFRCLRLDFHFYFPRWLRWLRPAEPFLHKLPLGGQYQVLTSRPVNPSPDP